MRTRQGPTGVLAAMLALILTTGCTTWRPAAGAPGDVIDERRPSSVRVTLADGEVATISSPLVLNDSIVSGGIAEPRIALSDVDALEVERLSVGRTIGLIAAGAVAAAAWTAVATGSSSGDDGGPDPLPKGFAADILNGLVWLGRLIH